MNRMEVPHETVRRGLARWLALGRRRRGPDEEALRRYVASLELGPIVPAVPVAGSDGGEDSEVGAHRSLRIALFTRWPYPHRGGLSAYIETLSSTLAEQGHEVAVVSERSFDRWRAVKRQMKGMAREAYAPWGEAARPLHRSECNLYTFERLLLDASETEGITTLDGERYRLDEFHVLHAQDLFTANILVHRRAHHRRPVVYTPHGVMSERKVEVDGLDPHGPAVTYYRLRDRIAAAWADRTVPLYDAFAEELYALGAEPERSRVVTTGIRPPEDGVLGDATGRGDDGSMTVTYLGRLTETKGAQYLLEAAARLRRRGVRVWIVGDGPLRSSLERLARRHRVDDVRFWGYRDDVIDILRCSDVTVVPGVNETLPVALIEAMFCGTAVVASRCGGIPDVIRPGETGLLFPPGDERALAEWLSELAKAPAARRRLAEAAQAYARKHLTADTMAAKIAAVYHEVLAAEEGESRD